MAVESSEKLKRAIRKQTRPYRAKYEVGQMLYFRRSSSSKWQGPAKLLAVDYPVHWLRNGSYLIRVHPCDLQPAKNHTPSKSSTENLSSISAFNCSSNSVTSAPQNSGQCAQSVQKL